MKTLRNTCLLVLACGAVAPATSQAAVVGGANNEGGGIVYSADPGETNKVSVSRDGEFIVIDDPGATISAGRGCESVTPKRVRCAKTLNTSIDLGDGDDSGTVAEGVDPVGGYVAFSGGPGNDELTGSSSSNYLWGEAGNDIMRGGSGTQGINAVDVIGYQNPEIDPTVLIEADQVTCVPTNTPVPLNINADRLDTIGEGCPAPGILSEPKPLSEGSKDRRKCKRSSTARGTKAVTRSKYGVVFTKRGNVYGCTYSVGRIAQLHDEGAGVPTSGAGKPILNGRYAVYATRGSAIGDEFDRVVVWDLRQGRVLYKANSTFVRKMVVKKNGSAAWIATSIVGTTDPAQPLLEVRQMADQKPLGDVLVDRGTDIQPTSLRLGSDSLSISWMRSGQEKTAELR